MFFFPTIQVVLIISLNLWLLFPVSSFSFLEWFETGQITKKSGFSLSPRENLIRIEKLNKRYQPLRVAHSDQGKWKMESDCGHHKSGNFPFVCLLLSAAVVARKNLWSMKLMFNYYRDSGKRWERKALGGPLRSELILSSVFLEKRMHVWVSAMWPRGE